MAEVVPFSSPPPQQLFPFLPDEISVLCIARVPVTSHTAISQVSRSWRSFVRSPSFFSVRSEIAVTELVLTVCTYDNHERRNQWYHLHPYPTPFPLLPSQDEEFFTCAAIGPHIFSVMINGHSSLNFLKIYNVTLRQWSEGPPTSIPRVLFAVGVADGRIHVINGYGIDIIPTAKSLDSTGTRWDPVPPSPAHLYCSPCLSDVAVLDGKLIVKSEALMMVTIWALLSIRMSESGPTLPRGRWRMCPYTLWLWLAGFRIYSAVEEDMMSRAG